MERLRVTATDRFADLVSQGRGIVEEEANDLIE